MEERRSNKKENHSSVNWWKWGFIGLVVVILLFSFQIMRSIQSVSINEPNLESRESSDQEMVFTTRASREDTEQMINTYLKTTLDESYDGFAVEIEDQLHVHGQLEVLSFTVPLSMSFDPYVLENGNVQLRAQSVELGSLSLPVSAAMSLMANQIEVPHFVAIDSEQQIIAINLNEFNEQNNIKIQMVRIDLPEDDIQMNLSIDEEVIIENFSNENN